MPRKDRITVSLSHASLRFLRTLRAKADAPSMSALIETILADLQSKAGMKQLEEQITSYYDAMPESSVQEDNAWGALGEATLAAEGKEQPAGGRR